MKLNRIEFQSIIRELQDIPMHNPILIPKHAGEFILHCQSQNNIVNILISLNPEHARIHSCSSTKNFKHSNPLPQHNTYFFKLFQSTLDNAIKTEIHCLKRDRVALFAWSHINQKHAGTLSIELIPGYENILLLNSENILLASLNPKRMRPGLKPGAPYQKPKPMPLLSNKSISEERIQRKAGLSFNFVVEEYFIELKRKTFLDQSRNNCKHILKKALQRIYTQISNMEKSICTPEQEQRAIQCAKLLQNNLFMIPPQQSIVQVPDWNSSNPDLNQIQIVLDPTKTPSENLDNMFKKIKKNQKAKIALQPKLSKLRQNAECLSQLSHNFSNLAITNMHELKNAILPFKQQLKTLSQALSQTIRRPPPPDKVTINKKNNSKTTQPYRIIELPSGKALLFGLNAKGNHVITFQKAKGHHLWLHSLNYPGSHGIIILKKNQQILLEDLLDAGKIIWKHSQGRPQDKVIIMYTRKKNVFPIKGQLGKTRISSYKTLEIET